jgi:hypothetical protein
MSEVAVMPQDKRTNSGFERNWKKMEVTIEYKGCLPQKDAISGVRSPIWDSE